MKWTTHCYYVKQNKPDSERQISCIFSHTQNLDLKRRQHGTEKRKGREVGRGRQGGRKKEGVWLDRLVDK